MLHQPGFDSNSCWMYSKWSGSAQNTSIFDPDWAPDHQIEWAWRLCFQSAALPLPWPPDFERKPIFWITNACKFAARAHPQFRSPRTFLGFVTRLPRLEFGWLKTVNFCTLPRNQKSHLHKKSCQLSNTGGTEMEASTYIKSRQDGNRLPRINLENILLWRSNVAEIQRS